MCRRPLNSLVLIAATYRRLKRVFDRTSTRVVAYIINKWRTKIKQKRLYNVRDPPEMGRRFIWELKRKHCNIKNWNCIQVWKEYNEELPSSNFDRGRISLHKACLFLFSYHLSHYECYPSHWSLVFNSLSTKIHCIGLFGPGSIFLFGLKIQNLP